MEFALDYSQALAVAFGDFIETDRLSIGRFPAVFGMVEGGGDFLAKFLGVWPLVVGEIGELAVGLGELMDGLGSIEVAAVELADEGEGADEVGGEELGVVKEVIYGGLSIGIGSGLWFGSRHVFEGSGRGILLSGSHGAS